MMSHTNKIGPLLTRTNHKTLKGEKHGYSTAVLNLLPADLSGWNLCPHSSPGCKASCLNYSGNAKTQVAQNARMRRSQQLKTNRRGFLGELHRRITLHQEYCLRRGDIPTVRLNATSDFPWERVARSVFDDHDRVQFYDYTKDPRRYQSCLDGKLPPNYDLTFSRSETNEYECLDFLHQGGRVAVVFPESAPLPSTWCGHRVIRGDDHDLRFRDPSGSVVGLLAKEKARKDTTGFVVPDSSIVPGFKAERYHICGDEFEEYTAVEVMQGHFHSIDKELEYLDGLSEAELQAHDEEGMRVGIPLTEDQATRLLSA